MLHSFLKMKESPTEIHFCRKKRPKGCYLKFTPSAYLKDRRRLKNSFLRGIGIVCWSLRNKGRGSGRYKRRKRG